MNIPADLRFDALFELAASEWPPTLEAGAQEIHPSGNHYPALWPYPDNIIEKHLGTPEEVLIARMHDQIGHAVRNAAEFMSTIRPAELRRSHIKRKFEEELRDRILPENGWGPEDFLLIDAYFEANRNDETNAAQD